MKKAKASESGIYEYRAHTTWRQVMYRLGGGTGYCDLGTKARACVDHDRRCAEIMRARA